MNMVFASIRPGSRRHSCTPNRMSAVDGAAAVSLRGTDYERLLSGDVPYPCVSTDQSFRRNADDPNAPAQLVFHRRLNAKNTLYYGTLGANWLADAGSQISPSEWRQRQTRALTMIEEIQRRCRPEVDRLHRAVSTQTPPKRAKLLILWRSLREGADHPINIALSITYEAV
jgi:hypothetical protein